MADGCGIEAWRSNSRRARVVRRWRIFYAARGGVRRFRARADGRAGPTGEWVMWLRVRRTMARRRRRGAPSAPADDAANTSCATGYAVAARRASRGRPRPAARGRRPSGCLRRRRTRRSDHRTSRRRFAQRLSRRHRAHGGNPTGIIAHLVTARLARRDSYVGRWTRCCSRTRRCFRTPASGPVRVGGPRACSAVFARSKRTTSGCAARTRGPMTTARTGRSAARRGRTCRSSATTARSSTASRVGGAAHRLRFSRRDRRARHGRPVRHARRLQSTARTRPPLPAGGAAREHARCEGRGVGGARRLWLALCRVGVTAMRLTASHVER